MAKPPVQSDVAGFLRKVDETKPPAQRADHRMIFALDATASREPTWDLAMSLHGELFLAAADLADVSVQLVYFRGYHEFVASPWSNHPKDLLNSMTGVYCRGGLTQIERTLNHATREASALSVKALILIGDACEEPLPMLAAAAGRLALYNVPVFAFQEGGDPKASEAFTTIADLTRGAHVPFQAGSARELKALLGAVARYAASGRGAVQNKIEHPVVHRLLERLPE